MEGECPMMCGSDCPCDAKSLFLTYDGRLNRKPFNIILVSSLLIAFLLFMLSDSLLVGLIFIVATVCPVIKRLHDREYSALWYAYFLLILLLSVILMFAPLSRVYEFFTVIISDHITLKEGGGWNTPAASLASLAVLGLMTYMGTMGWFMTELCFFRGTEGPNEYGPDPLDGVSSSCEEIKIHHHKGKSQGDTWS
jgi:uncharacterized membrane protein YhaH (DUF805 family)